ncbi:response regulator transcription factor [uncultured Pseudokineococcus sp.]|uniref:response regulator transcription factor n=1 Tax=uncultured Pseudokineococcus sp. TaxID=1642928 RepID=UPI002631BE15|nr:response regulator transcription factor [uncultured Pseudokineococcus sp.]
MAGLSTGPDDDGSAAGPPEVRVLVVDDERLMRAGLRLMVDGAAGIRVVGEAADGAQAVAAVAELDPDVVLMDVRMPGTSGLEATRQLTGAGARARVVVLTAFETDDHLLEALRAGAVSFLLKDAPPEAVVAAVHDAAQGHGTFSPSVLARLVALAAAPPGPPTTAPPAPAGRAPGSTGPPGGTTPREWEVGRFVAQGLTNAEIAAALFLSTTTVKTHLTHLFEKLHVTNRVQLAIRVLEHDAG